MKMWWCLYRERPQNKEIQTEVSFVHYMKHLAPPLTPDPAPQRSDELAGALPTNHEQTRIKGQKLRNNGEVEEKGGRVWEGLSTGYEAGL